jgi:hypothetical protein
LAFRWRCLRRERCRANFFGVSSSNVPTLVFAVIVVSGCTLVASAIPAVRAVWIGPMETLRDQ